MKTIADIKRAMTVGSKWHTVHHGYAPDWTPQDMGVRAISIAQTNSVAFRTIRGADSWIQFPKKNQVIFHNDGKSFSIIDPGFGQKPLLTYTLMDKNTIVNPMCTEIRSLKLPKLWVAIASKNWYQKMVSTLSGTVYFQPRKRLKPTRRKY